MGRPKGSKNGRWKERKERQLAEMRKTPIDALTTLLEPEEGLVCMGDGCFCHRLTHVGNGAQNRCAYRKKGGEVRCDVLEERRGRERMQEDTRGCKRRGEEKIEREKRKKGGKNGIL